MKEFTTAANEVLADNGEDERVWEFKVDGRECRAFKPKDGQLAVLMATTHSHASSAERVAGIINFFVAVLDDESHAYIVQKLLDRTDPFGLEEVTSIMNWLIEEWSGRPTQ